MTYFGKAYLHIPVLSNIWARILARTHCRLSGNGWADSPTDWPPPHGSPDHTTQPTPRRQCWYLEEHHCSDVIMGAMASQITSPTIVYATLYSGADQRKHRSSASLVFVRGIHRWPVNSPHKWPVTRKMFPFDDVIMWRRQGMEILWSFEGIIQQPACWFATLFRSIQQMWNFTPSATNLYTVIVILPIGQVVAMVAPLWCHSLG